jgi:hypothetical protein
MILLAHTLINQTNGTSSSIQTWSMELGLDFRHHAITIAVHATSLLVVLKHLDVFPLISG